MAKVAKRLSHQPLGCMQHIFLRNDETKDFQFCIYWIGLDKSDIYWLLSGYFSNISLSWHGIGYAFIYTNTYSGANYLFWHA
jgi:hypothetical protein